MTITIKPLALSFALASLTACGASPSHDRSPQDRVLVNQPIENTPSSRAVEEAEETQRRYELIRDLVLIPLHQVALDTECGCPNTSLDHATLARLRADAYAPSLLAMAAGFDPSRTESNAGGLAACLDEVRNALADCSTTRLPRACELDRVLDVTGLPRDASPTETRDFARAAGVSCSADRALAMHRRPMHSGSTTRLQHLRGVRGVASVRSC